MSMTDPVADYLTRIRNGDRGLTHDVVQIPASRLKRELARILAEQGYIEAWETEAPSAERPGEHIRIQLKYTEDRKSVVSSRACQRVPSGPASIRAGHRRDPEGPGWHGHRHRLRRPQGVMTGHEARRRGVGGEVVAKVW